MMQNHDAHQWTLLMEGFLTMRKMMGGSLQHNHESGMCAVAQYTSMTAGSPLYKQCWMFECSPECCGAKGKSTCMTQSKVKILNIEHTIHGRDNWPFISWGNLFCKRQRVAPTESCLAMSHQDSMLEI